MGKPKKKEARWRTSEAMLADWEAYKAYCDSQMVLTHEFSQKQGAFISAELRRQITYTIIGFCVYSRINISAFYETYEEKDRHGDFKAVLAQIRGECEFDVRRKLELGIIPERLAPLWMSKYGYSAKPKEENADGDKALQTLVAAIQAGAKAATGNDVQS